MTAEGSKPLKNARHEAFALGLVKEQTAEKAYAEAGFRPSRPHASRLAADGNVARRVLWLKQRAARKAILTKERALELLSEIAEDKATEETRDRIAAMKTAGTWSSWETGNEAQIRVADALCDELTDVRAKR